METNIYSVWDIDDVSCHYVKNENKKSRWKTRIKFHTTIDKAFALSNKVLDEKADSTFHTDVFSCWPGLDDLQNEINMQMRLLPTITCKRNQDQLKTTWKCAHVDK